ncbi:DUF3106 domain-containing protein [Luteimonas terricola]|uniref:DUF3106 domain-containing protein n=1 Tax=Luteimonas terricola TaxID=645597 RepID=A0ABQ2E9T0_9GAMM|nr:DUF3106 domain-containing protein [Luteimonas terricola]GGJ97219.1 hypothetical protein GCM10011394_02610 [Luteimonas terricola]
MTPRLPTEPADAAAPTALGAFLRGVERRGLVFARLLAGSREAGDDALAWALERFAGEAGRIAFGEWPRRFWSLLLAAPALRRTPSDPGWDPRFEWLSRIGHGPRAALLLRLVAGLAESDAASVLGIARPTYRLGLQRALPHHADGSADVEAWQALGQAAQDMQRALPPGSLALSLRLGERVGDGTGDAAPPRASGRQPAGRGVRAALWLVALVTLGGLGATFVAIDRLPEGLDEAPGHILSEPLSMAEPPAGRYADEDALALHPDLGLLLDGEDQDAAAADPAFHAWLVAEARANADADAASAGVAASAAAIARPEPRSRPATERLAALDPAARTRLVQRRDQWDALPHAERGDRRERWQAWHDFSATERAQLRQVVAGFALRSPDEQAALRARFDAMDASERHGWLLGPDLGADYPRLHPLIAQVPLDARTALLEALRGLDPQARDDLAVLAARTPPQARAELRIELLAIPAAQRGRWLRRTVAPVQ